MASSATPIDFASGNHYTVLGVAQNATEADAADRMRRDAAGEALLGPQKMGISKQISRVLPLIFLVYNGNLQPNMGY